MMRIIFSLRFTLVIMSCICLLLVGFFVNNIANKSIDGFSDYIFQSELSETRSLAYLIDKDFETMITLMNSLATTQTVRKIYVFWESAFFNTQYQNLTENVRQHLRLLEMSLNTADKLAIFYPEQMRVLDSTSLRYCPPNIEYLMEDCLSNGSICSVAHGDQLYFVSSINSKAIVYAQLGKATLSSYLRQHAGDTTSFSVQYLLLQSDPAAERFSIASQEVIPHHEYDRLLSFIQENKDPAVFTLSNGETFLISWSTLQATQMQLLRITPYKPIRSKLDSFTQSVFLSLGAALAIVVLLVSVLSWTLTKPIVTLRHALSSFEKGRFDTRINETWIQEFQPVFRGFNHMAEHIQRLIEKEYTLQLLNTRAELKQLQCQINPHFLYNSYFLLKALLYNEQYEEASHLSELLGNYMKYITHYEYKEVSLAEEISHARAYAEIQQLRFSNRVQISFAECAERWLVVMIPRLVIQPLIENAFEHGVKARLSDGLITVSYCEMKDGFQIHVDDNGDTASDKDIQHIQALIEDQSNQNDGEFGIALLNIQKRLSLAYRNSSGLSVERSPLGGFRCTITVDWRR